MDCKIEGRKVTLELDALEARDLHRELGIRVDARLPVPRSVGELYLALGRQIFEIERALRFDPPPPP